MKNIKKILLLCLIFILSGCSVEYNLTINEDGSISEKVITEEVINRMESYTGLKGDQAVKYLYNMFKRNDKNMNLSTKTDDNNMYATVTNSLKNLDEYKNNFSSDVFEIKSIDKKDGLVTILMQQTKKLGGNTSRQLVYDDITINFIVPYVVKENNADSVSGNTYTWNIQKNQELKTIKLSYEEGNLENYLNIKINDKTYNIHYGIIVISGIILVLLVIILVVYIKNKKNNAL